MVSDPQNIVPLYLSLVSRNPLTVPLARWPSILNSPEIEGEYSLLRLALTGSTPQLDSNVPFHSPAICGGIRSGEVGDSSHAGRQDRVTATSSDRCMRLTGCNSKFDTARHPRIRRQVRHSSGGELQDGA